MVPDYTSAEVITIKTSGEYIFEPNIIPVDNSETNGDQTSGESGGDQTVVEPEEPEEPEPTEYFGGHYYLIIGSTGTFNLTETYIDKDAEDSGNEESGSVSFGITDIYTEHILPINGRSKITINGTGISKLIKVPTRQ